MKKCNHYWKIGASDGKHAVATCIKCGTIKLQEEFIKDSAAKIQSAKDNGIIPKEE